MALPSTDEQPCLVHEFGLQHYSWCGNYWDNYCDKATFEPDDPECKFAEER